MIAFISDWGYRSYYVGVAKSVIMGISPESRIVDITHDIRDFDIEETSHVIERVFDDLPKGTVLLVVVDPGVGSKRKAVVAEIDGKFCVVPDNGVLTRLLNKKKVFSSHSIENPEYFYKNPPSSTFHGRDIFAAAAAYVDKGVDPSKLGPEWKDLIFLKTEKNEVTPGIVRTRVAYVDGFGNVETTVTREDMKRAGIFGPKININGKRAALVENYSEGDEQIILAHHDSSEYLEISSNCGNAAGILGLSKGDSVRVEKV